MTLVVGGGRISLLYADATSLVVPLLSVNIVFLFSNSFNLLLPTLADSFVPSSVLMSKYPLAHLPKMKHSLPLYLTLSNSLNPHTMYGSWLRFL